MKKAILILMSCILLCACGNTAQTNTDVTEVQKSVEETSTDEMATMESTVEETEEATVEETAVDEAEAEPEFEPKKLPEKEFTVSLLENSQIMYATTDLNVRSGPSTDYDVVSHLKIAQEVKVTGQADSGWYQVFADGGAAYVSDKYLSEEPVEVPQPAPVAAAPADPSAPAQQTVVAAPAGVIMVGDSRCVQMQAAVGGGGCSWVCENSKEYTWFSETAIPRFDQYVGRGTKVVICMGVNDPEHYRQYAELVNVKAAEWAARGARTYFVSVNPVWENPYTTQEQVDTFNANVPGMLSGVTWIDTSSWLNANGYRLVDGLHFDDPTSVNIFNLIMGSL